MTAEGTSLKGKLVEPCPLWHTYLELVPKTKPSILPVCLQLCLPLAKVLLVGCGMGPTQGLFETLTIDFPGGFHFVTLNSLASKG